MPGAARSRGSPVAGAGEPVTTSRYDVVEKTIGQLRADMESGLTTSQEITRAYLDRIAVYDQGQFGFNAYEFVADRRDGAGRRPPTPRARRARARPCSASRSRSRTSTTPRTWRRPTAASRSRASGPKTDAFQVARLREAGAVIIGKAALEEYATSGNYSNDPWGQVWNAFKPSKSALASSGGSATAVAANLAAGALGSQTGDSLYAPATGASLVTLRGTDGLESGTGIMPLSWLTDFGGAMTRSVSDLADMLNVVAGTDPDDPTTAPADAEHPADWRSVLDPDALQGKRIGYIPSVWVDPFGTTGTTDASKAALQYLDRRRRDDRRDGLDRGRRQHAARARRQRRPATPTRRAGCSTSTPSRAGRAGLPDPQRGRRELLAEEGLLRARRTRAPAPSRRRRG